MVPPTGNGHVYNSSFTMPGTKASGVVYLKVYANKSSGSPEQTGLKKVLYGLNVVK
jgi:hypothetical protein